jgi:hypothetical protein
MKIVSPAQYEDRKRAEEWMDLHEPDEGKTLKVVKKVARQYVQWGSWL